MNFATIERIFKLLTLIQKREWQRFLLLPNLVEVYKVTTVDCEAVKEMVQKYAIIDHGLGSTRLKDITLPQRNTWGNGTLFLLKFDCTDFLPEDNEERDRNIREREALREMKKRGYEPGGLLEMIDLITTHPELLKSKRSFVGFQILLVNGEETMCSITCQQPKEIIIRTHLNTNCERDSQFLAKRQY